MKKNYWLIMLIAILALGVGYAAVANIDLIVGGRATASGNATDEDFVVRFVQSDDASSEFTAVAQAAANPASYVTSDGSNATASASVTDDENATFSITGLSSVGEYVTFTYYVTNLSEGLPAYVYVDVVNSNNDQNNYFKVTRTIGNSELTEKGSVTPVNVKVEVIALPKFDLTGNFTVKLVASATKNAKISSEGVSTVLTTASTTNEIDDLLADTSVDNVNITLTNNVDYANTGISIPVDKSVTIDLNGNNFNGSVVVEGDLTVEGNGNFTGQSNNNVFEVESDATLTINGGNYTTAYTVGFIDGGSIVINDGTFNCQNICFSGNANGEYEDFNMTVNGGTFNSAQGSNFYIPNPGTLTINDGTLNGGILYRMATVNINGGVINGSASTNSSDYDSYQGYYNYSGEPWFGDAISIISSAYAVPAASSATDINPVLNITGGTISANNGRGTALAILNLGKLEATPVVNISGGTFSTNADRNTFEILNANDLNASADYKANNNFVNATITGGNGLTGVTTSGNYWNTTTQFENGVTTY